LQHESFAKKTSLFYFSLYFEGSPQQKNLGSYAVGEIPLHFYIPMKDFLMGRIGKIQKVKKERMEERKRRLLSFFLFNFF